MLLLKSERYYNERLAGGLDLVRGRIIENIHVVPEKIIFTFPDIKLVVEALGDCCSYSYFVNTDQLQTLIGQPLNSIEYDKDYIEVKHDDRYNEIERSHVVKINDVEFQMINESNGWYDGIIDVYATSSSGSRSKASSRSGSGSGSGTSRRDLSVTNMTVR